MSAQAVAPGIVRRAYGRLADGRPVHEYTLDNGAGLSLRAINLGGIVIAIRVPDRRGVAGNVVLGLASLADYQAPHPHIGTIVGRCANRVAQGRFVVDGRPWQIQPNDGGHSLHGGPVGFGRCWWQIEPLPPDGEGSVAIELSHVSADGDQGYPGELRARVRYTLTARNEWRIDYRATCDRPTSVNLTHHSYFNLAGAGSALDHGAAGQPLRRGDGLCLETQHFPDAPNHPEFPSTVLRPGEPYASTTVHRFGICNDTFDSAAT